jgi:hypothetical protein
LFIWVTKKYKRSALMGGGQKGRGRWTRGLADQDALMERHRAHGILNTFK